MNVATRPRMTLAQFLDWEERQPLRYEFDGRRPLAMTGGNQAHAIIQSNLVRVIGNALVGSPCRVFGSDLKVATGASVRYPDAFVACSPVEPNSTVMSEPIIVFEVLSASTAEQDFTAKNAEYRGMPSVQRYVVLEQAKVGATVFHRHGELWVTERLFGVEAFLELPEIKTSVSLADVYAGITILDEDIPEQSGP